MSVSIIVIDYNFKLLCMYLRQYQWFCLIANIASISALIVSNFISVPTITLIPTIWGHHWNTALQSCLQTDHLIVNSNNLSKTCFSTHRGLKFPPSQVVIAWLSLVFKTSVIERWLLLTLTYAFLFNTNCAVTLCSRKNSTSSHATIDYFKLLNLMVNSCSMIEYR